MKRVLILNTVQFTLNGITSVICNYVSHMDMTDIQLVFVALPGISPEVREQLEKYGRIHIIPDRKGDVGGYLRGLRKILAGGYDAVHIHGNSATMLLDVVTARLAGVPNIITHGHSTSSNHPLFHKIMHAPMAAMATHRLACSKAAGEWLYGSREFRVLNNAIELEKYRFNAKTRAEVRAELGVEDEYVIGHVGYLADPKNQPFLVDVFKKYHETEPKSKLILVGEGADRPLIEAQIEALGLQESVILTGRRTDVDRLCSAMDIFVMPSKWEGFSISMLEAQASGLPILASDVIPEDVKCLERVEYMALEEGVDCWAHKIYQIQLVRHDRSIDPVPSLREKGFDIKEVANTQRKLYLGEM